MLDAIRVNLNKINMVITKDLNERCNCLFRIISFKQGCLNVLFHYHIRSETPVYSAIQDSALDGS